MWYNVAMNKIVFKKETLKEFGKLFFDTFKIVVAVAIIAPLVKGEAIGFTPFVFSILPLFAGVYFINKGAKDE